jgi:UDPglucose 6-dehydrogenase
MKIGVVGLWHLGSVTAMCLAEAGFKVIGYDNDETVITNFNNRIPPIYEPGLEDLLKKNIGTQISFTNDPALLSSCDLVWVTYDTPVDDNDVADTEFVERSLALTFPYLKDNAVVLVSSQMPVGSTKKLQAAFNKLSTKNVFFCYSPENLRLGKAIDVFRNPDRIIAGINSDDPKAVLTHVFEKFSEKIIWISVESAEMTKHAINAFLATSVVFINELAVLCEQVGADAGEVERGLKSEARIGPKAYLRAGNSFAGGTLARDIAFLIDKGDEYSLPSFLFRSIKQSNDHHKAWMCTKLLELFSNNLVQKNISILGLTYKPGTNTLRRSSAVELCKWLFEQGAIVTAYDPAVSFVEPELAIMINCVKTIEIALAKTDAVVICTEWPEFTNSEIINAINTSKVHFVIDPNNFLSVLKNNKKLRHIIIGKSK